MVTSCITLPIVNIVLNVAILAVIIGFGLAGWNYIQNQGMALLDAKAAEYGSKFKDEMQEAMGEEARAMFAGMMFGESEGNEMTPAEADAVADALAASRGFSGDVLPNHFRRDAPAPTCPHVHNQELCNKFTNTCNKFEPCNTAPSMATCFPFMRSLNAACQPEIACSYFDDVTACRTVRNLCVNRGRAVEAEYRDAMRASMEGLCNVLHKN